MPLPTDSAASWPPPGGDKAAGQYREWAAWWSGDVTDLSKVYLTAVGFAGPVIDGHERQALAALRPRMFHGSPAARGSLQSAKLHIPLASDIAMTSADLLFGEPPALVAPKDDPAGRPKPAPKPTGGGGDSGPVAAKPAPTQQRLDFYMANGLQAALLEGAEIAAAFGGVYLRVGWDTEIADHPLFDAIAPDAAIPEFRSGHLVAVTFHRVLSAQGDGKTWRHLERHEANPGRILHGLYASGDDKTLGVKMPLADHPDTKMFASMPGADAGGIVTGAKGLAVQYVPNMRPNRKLRGSQLGRSDYDGVVTVLDALDEAWTSWMRDLRLGKGRIVVPEVYLEAQGRGNGSLFDMEQEVFQVVNALPGGGANGGLAMNNVQFEIRVEQHQRTCAALTEQAVRGAGYSAQSFGIQDDGGMATATEVTARQSRSFMTRGKKINYWREPLAQLTQAALQIDIKQFKPDGVASVLPTPEWPDGIAVDPQTQAQTLQLLAGAQAASIRTRVEMLHPDWDDTRVAEEVKLIEAEHAPPAAPGIGPPGATVGNAADGSNGQPGSGQPGNGQPGGEKPPTQDKPAANASGTGQTPTGSTPNPASGTPRPARPTLAAGRPRVPVRR